MTDDCIKKGKLERRWEALCVCWRGNCLENTNSVEKEQSKWSVTATGFTASFQFLPWKHRYPTIASNTHTCKQMNTLGITTPAHAIMYIHIGVEADMETKSRNRVPAVGSHKYSQAPTLFFPSVPTSISVGWEMIWSGSVFWSLVWTHGVQQQWKMRLLSHGHLFF